MDNLERVARWKANFWLFATECLGYRKNLGVGWEDLTPEHKALCYFLQGDPYGVVKDHRFKLILMPRYSLKSCLITTAYSLWTIINDPNVRILIYSDTATKAEGFLGDIKNHILGKGGSSLFAEVFGGYETSRLAGKWNDSQILVSARTVAQREPTIDTGGIESSKVGNHYDIIFFDDIVSDLNTTTKAQMEKTFECYRKSLSLLKPGGRVVMVGTRWQFGDTYGKILDENKSTNEWGVFVRKAEVGGEYPFAQIGLNKEFLENQRARIGSFLYGALYQNDPVDDSTALFKHDDFTFYNSSSVDYSNLFITCCCDPAAEGEDYTAFTVVGTDKNLNLHLLYAKHEHYMPSQIVDEIVKLSYGYKFVKFGIETRIFNGMLEKELDLRLAKERQNPLFKPFSVEIFTATCRQGEGKNARIMSLQPYHERKALLFPGESVEKLRGSFAELASQMMQYTQTHRPTHDDLIDSLSYHVQLVRPGTGEVEKKPEECSIMGIIERERQEANKLQGRYPRRYRKYLQPVFGLLLFMFFAGCSTNRGDYKKTTGLDCVYPSHVYINLEGTEPSLLDYYFL